MRILGIDPGLSSGAAAIIEVSAPDMFRKTYSFDLLDVLDIPTAGEDARKRVKVLDFDAWLRKWQPEIAGIERAQSVSYVDRTGQRRAQANSFIYGRGVGYIEAAVILAKVRMFTVEPGQWKPIMGLGDKSKKNLSLDKAREMFPDKAAQFFARQKDHNRAESALIARFTADEYFGLSAPMPARGKRGKAA